MPTFSLIVPVYKIADYLPKCIESVLAQSCQDYELLLIDDGSPDRCGEICDDYAARYPDKIRAIHQPNGGAGAARNRGIAMARGEFLLFVDGDDYLSPEMLAELKAEVEKTPADLYLFGAQVEKDGKPNGELHELIPCGKLCIDVVAVLVVFRYLNRFYVRSTVEERYHLHDVIDAIHLKVLHHGSLFGVGRRQYQPLEAILHSSYRYG